LTGLTVFPAIDKAVYVGLWSRGGELSGFGFRDDAISDKKLTATQGQRNTLDSAYEQRYSDKGGGRRKEIVRLSILQYMRPHASVIHQIPKFAKAMLIYMNSMDPYS
jgi:hypothetical protein